MQVPKGEKAKMAVTNSTKLVSTERHGENRLCTYPKCACAVAKGGAAVQLRYSECKCQKAKRQKGLVHIQRSLLVQNNAMKIGYVHTWNVCVRSLKATQPCS